MRHVALAWCTLIPSAVMQELGEGVVGAVLDSLARATEAAPGWAKAWHNWALYNVSTMEHYAHYDVQAAQRHVAPAVLGFFRSVALAQAQGETWAHCPASLNHAREPSDSKQDNAAACQVVCRCSSVQLHRDMNISRTLPSLWAYCKFVFVCMFDIGKWRGGGI